MDFRDLNKACPKDEFPLPNIDMLVDVTADYSMFSFMDEFSGYNQIKMDSFDAEKTAFRTPMGNFHYKDMTLGLKNAGATYQCATSDRCNRRDHFVLSKKEVQLEAQVAEIRGEIEKVQRILEEVPTERSIRNLHPSPRDDDKICILPLRAVKSFLVNE